MVGQCSHSAAQKSQEKVKSQLKANQHFLKPTALEKSQIRGSWLKKSQPGNPEYDYN